MQLTGREKMAVAIGGAALLLFVLLQFLLLPLIDNRSRLHKRLASKEKAVAEMRVLKEQYQRLHARSGSIAAQLAQREEGFSLFSFVEKNADESAVKEHIAYMKPSESRGNDQFAQSMVEIRLQAISLDKLLAFLKITESPEHLVGLEKIAIQQNTKEEGTLDATLLMVSIDKVASATP
jgi:general secretion pathway protein M